MADVIVRVVDESTTVVLAGADLIASYVAEAEADIAATAADAEADIAASASSATTSIAASAAGAAASATAAAASAAAADASADAAADSADAAANSAAAASASAFDAADSAAQAEAVETAALAAIAGLPASPSMNASSRIVLAGLSTAGGLPALLTETGREGMFTQMNAAAVLAKFGISGTALVTADPGQGMFVPYASDTSGASGGWVRATDHLTMEMFGSGVTSDDTTPMRRCFYMACLTKLPIQGKGVVIQNGPILVGLLTGAGTPTTGLADRVRVKGLKVQIAAGLNGPDGIIHFINADSVSVENVNFDVTTQATYGSGQVRFSGCTNFSVENVFKIRTTAVGITTGGSVVSIQAGCDGFAVKNVETEYCGNQADAVALVSAKNGQLERIHCIGGGEIIDFSGCENVHADVVTGNVDEGIDVGNCRNCSVKNAKFTARQGVDIKTEGPSSGYPDTGTQDFLLHNFDITFTDYGIIYSGGATSTQSLHRNKFTKGKLTSTTATGASRAIRFISGDVATDPTSGTLLEDIQIEMNAGYGIELSAMINYDCRNVSCVGAPLLTDLTAGTFTTASNALWEDIQGTGDFAIAHRKATFRNFLLSGGVFAPTNGIGSKYFNVEVVDAPAHAFDFRFENSTLGTANKDVEIANCKSNGAGISSTGYNLRIRHTGTPGPIENIRINGFTLEDSQESLAFTSGGTYQVVVGDTVVGNTSAATGVVTKVTLSGGTWAGGDAAGTLLVRDRTGTFSAAENINIVANGVVTHTNVATASGASAAAPTSGGLSFENATFDKCTARGVVNYGVTSAQNYGFIGLNSVNDPNNRVLKDLMQQRSGGSFTLAMQFANRPVEWTSSGTVTLPPDAAGTTDFPQGTVFTIINLSGGSQTIMAGAGVTNVGPTTIPNNGTATITKGRVASKYYTRVTS